MTDNSDKIRSIVLAALMVFSVFAGTVAFAGTAAANASSVNFDSTSDTEVDEGATVNNYQLTYNLTDYTEDGSPEVVYVEFANDDIESLSPNSASTNDSDGIAQSIELVDGPDGDTTDDTLRFEIADQDNSGTKDISFTVDTGVTFPTGIPSNQSVDVTVHYEDSDGTVQTTSNQPTTIIQAQQDSSTADVVLADNSDNGTVAWAGQTVGTTYWGDDVDVSLRRVTETGTTLITQKNTGADSFVQFDLSGRQTGDYIIRSGAYDIGFEVAEQELSVGFTADSVDNSGPSSAVEVDFTAESNRPSYTHVLEAEGPDGAVSASTLQTILGNAGTVEDADGDGVNELTVPGSNDDAFTGNFSGVAPGNYTITSTVEDTGESDSATVTVNDVGAGEVTFENGNVEVAQGDVAELNVSYSGNVDTATVVIGSLADDGYQANVTVIDDDGDGNAVIEFNTFTAGNDSLGTVVSGASSDTVVEFDNSSDQTNVSAILATGEYTIATSTASDAQSTLDSPQDIGTLYIADRSTGEMQLWTAPGGADLNADGESGVTESDLATLIEDGLVTQDDTITAGDYVVHQVTATGLEGAIAANGGLGATLGNGVTVTVEQTNPIQNRDPKVINIGSSGDAVTLVEGDGAYYIAVNTGSSDLNVTRNGNAASLADGDEFEATFTITSDRLLGSTEAAAHESVNATFEVESAMTSLDSSPVEVEAASNQTISGTTNYAPGTELTVRVRSTDDTQPRFFNTNTVTVSADGTFSTEFDFSEQATNDTFSVNVRQGGTQVASADGMVVESTTEATPTATATPEPTETATPEPTETATPEPTETDAPETPEPTETPEDDTTTTTTPGFGVAVALVALLAAALLAGRRE